MFHRIHVGDIFTSLNLKVQFYFVKFGGNLHHSFLNFSIRLVAMTVSINDFSSYKFVTLYSNQFSIILHNMFQSFLKAIVSQVEAALSQFTMRSNLDCLPAQCSNQNTLGSVSTLAYYPRLN